jgi:hypothetical protein
MRLCWHVFAVIVSAAPLTIGTCYGGPFSQQGENSGHALPSNVRVAEGAADDFKPQEPDTDLLALMSGKCSTLRVADRDFACRSMAYSHSLRGRAYFTIALDDPADRNHIISFSGENGRRTQQNFYELTVDRMLLNSTNRPKIDGLPVPSVELSTGRCTQLGNFAAGQVSSVSCTATDKNGKKYELQFESDGSPITIRRVKPSPPTIRERG